MDSDPYKRCARAASRRVRKLINGTGIILHTNLGRAPLPPAVWDTAAAVNTGYSSLELDLATGRRGRRGGIVPDLLGLLTGCEDALVVNNNAAAILLALTALAQGREVIVSRGEQVQIGGGFRIPEILALSGARMVEVGTTNITTREDYLRAVTSATAMVLLVHSSNFRIRGFTEKPGVAALASGLPPLVILAVVTGVLFGGMSLGGMVFPLLMGSIAAGIGIARTYWFCAVVAFGLLVAVLLAGKPPATEQPARRPPA